jgi:glycosyltransferase involved in cell wall biosynthesis
MQERFQWIGSALFLQRFLEKHRITLFHSTNPINIPLSRRFKTLVTVYDLIPTLFYDDYLRGKPNTRASYSFNTPRLKMANHIIAISRQTKLDCMQLLKIPDDKISVVYIGLDQKRYSKSTDQEHLRESRNRLKLPDRFFLYVGGIDPRKNVSRILEAFALVAKNFPDFLLLVGPWSPADEEQLLTLSSALEISNRVRILTHINVEDLVVLYSLSTALLFPSLYEGFGLPVAEAFSCGTAVLCSRTSSLGEIGEGAALLVDPQNVKEIAEGIESLATNPDLRKSLEGEGYERSKLYLQQNMIRETLKIYERVLST